MPLFKFTVNGKKAQTQTDGDRPLLEVLREDFRLTGAKYSCGEGSCRSCTVIVDGRPLASCQVPVSKADGKSITTIEGLENDGRLHPLQQAFIDESAMQCGYCVPGMILTAEALLRNKPKPARDEIVEFMNGNICRCCNYVNIVNAIEAAAQQTKESPSG